MNIIKNDNRINLDDKIKEYEGKLKREKIVTLCTVDHLEHIAAYIAWSNIGGNIFVKYPSLPKELSEYIDNQVSQLNIRNSVLFQTSGTTGYPKLVINTEKQFYQAELMSTKAMAWTNDTKFLNFVPAFTTGFWHIIIPTFIKHKESTVVLGSKETILSDLQSDVNSVLLVPGLIDQLRIKNVSLDLSKFGQINCGASAVFDRHVKFIFNNKGNAFNHMYGASEIGSPILSRLATHADDDSTYLELSSNCDSIVKIENNELCVKGPSVCENYTDWYQTGDLFEVKDNLIKFSGRTNEIIKINGYTASLLLIETLTEERLNLGETRARLRNRTGSDFIELEYTNKDITIDKKVFSSELESILPHCCIPAKYTLVDSIPKNPLGKKLREK